MPCLPSMKSIFSYSGKLHISPKMDKGGQALLCLAHLVCHIAKLPVFLKTDLASLQEYSRQASTAMNTDRLFRNQKRSCGMRNTSMFRWITFSAEQTALTVFGTRTNEIINPLMRKHRKSLTCVLMKTLPSAKS